MTANRALLAVAAFASAHLALVWGAESLLQPERVSLDSLAGFRPLNAGNWRLVGGIGGDPRRDKVLVGLDGTGVLICNPTKTARENLFTAWEHGDIELELDFLMTPGSNSGVYLQGRYEVQLFDSWGVREPKHSDCGGIYQRWDVSRPEGQKGFEGTAPRANASRAPGLWQHLRVEFEAPRFDGAGKKIKNARFVKVELNGFVIHENVEVTGPTRSGAYEDERPMGPLMVQGDHASVALRGLAIKRRDPGARILVEDLAYKLYAGDFKKVGDYDSATPTLEGPLESFSHAVVKKGSRFGLVITGKFIVPRTGEYAFMGEAQGSMQLMVDNRLAIVPFDRNSVSVRVPLSAGAHPFRLDYHKTGGDRYALLVAAEGPGMVRQTLTAPDSYTVPTVASKTMVIEPEGDRVRLQRSFVPFEPRKRLYAINVGTPAGVHYAYDFETGALLRAWRGKWLDTVEMWENRGNNQVGNPAGPSLTFNALPTVAFIEYPQRDGWPVAPDAMWSSQGYVLEPNGQPVFLSTLSSIGIRDRIAPVAEGRGLARTLVFSGKRTDWQATVLLAQASTITPQPKGGGWIIGEREWYLDWPAESAHLPVVQSRGGQQQLVVRLSDGTLNAPLAYTLVW